MLFRACVQLLGRPALNRHACPTISKSVTGLAKLIDGDHSVVLVARRSLALLRTKIVAYQQDVADFFDSIGLRSPSSTSARHGSFRETSRQAKMLMAHTLNGRQRVHNHHSPPRVRDSEDARRATEEYRSRIKLEAPRSQMGRSKIDRDLNRAAH